jgi:D-alanyl-D-alanine carboxypeptidase (penicillin-binding protein 5/6)
VVLGVAAGIALGPAAGTAGGSVGPVGGAELGGRGLIVNYPAGGGLPVPRVKASAFVVADAGTGQVLAAKDPHGWYRPASTLKVLTAITLMPVLKAGQRVVASQRAATVTPSKVGLIQGDSYQVSDLFRALLMISANDAAIALAQATGSFGKGVAMMNAEARRLRADDTVAKRPNGLDASGQHTSAYDEALWARQALTIPALMRDLSLRVATFPRRPGHRPVKLWNQDLMLDTYPGDLGGKIGWTTKARATFIGWARRGNRTLIVTILHCKPLTEMTAAARLLDWGFAMDGRIKPVGTLVPPLPAGTRASQPPAASRRGPRPLARAASLPGLPGIPLSAAVAALALAATAAAAIVLFTRRPPHRP